MSERKRLITDLRVIDLRVELEKRNLDKSGVRGVLIQRLKQHLEEQGENPATFTFDVLENKTPVKKTRRSESTVEQEAEGAPAMEDMIVQDDVGEEEETEQPQESGENTAEPSTAMEVDSNTNVNRKRDSSDNDGPTQAKKPCLEKTTEEDQKANENNTEAEDSINLDLGEDELLNEETDNTSKSKKDEGGEGEGDAAEAASAATAGAEPAATAADSPQVNAEAPPTSDASDEKNDKDQKDDKEKDDTPKDKKDEKDNGARNLWVSGLSGDTRAKDLKQLCSKYGKVIGAKVVTNARTPGSRCYGYVTMASSQDAENCIKNLHRTELHGRMISVEKAKSESDTASRRQVSKQAERRSSKEQTKEGVENKEENKESGVKGDESKVKKDLADSERSTSRTREKSQRSDKEVNRGRRSTRSRERRRSPREVLSFNKIWKERDVARARERSRAAREEERRRRAADEALRERERRQRQEKHRLELEREKLRAEREKIEREKNELLRLERERHRLEREKLELERLELKRAQIRLEEERRKRGYEGSSGYRKPEPPEPAYERHGDPRDPRGDPRQHKRPPMPPMSSRGGQFEAPPPPRFEMPAPAYERDKRDRERDYKRDYPPRHVSSAASSIKYPTNGNSNDDSRQPLPPGTRVKEPSRAYESRDNRQYRPSPPTKPESRAWPARYQDNAPPNKTGGSAAWSASSGSAPAEPRYYEARYPAAYQPPPPGATYPDRYAPQHARNDYRKY